MIASPEFAAAVARALVAVRDRVRDRLAAEVPPDVTVIATGDGVVIEGVALAPRSLTDVRLRDVAGLVR